MAMRLPLSIFHRRLSSIASFVPRRHIVALAEKRSPKRLKYSTPRFTKEGELVYIEVKPSGVDAWKLEPIIHLLKEGAVGVIPTDTVYTIACDCKNHSAVERLRRIKKIESSKPLSILCRSLRDIDTFIMGFTRGDGHGHANVFQAVKQCLLGPEMDAPLICTTVKGPKENEWMIDPTAIRDIYGPEGLDFVVDGGVRVAEASTIVDMTGPFPKVAREGKDDESHLRQDFVASGT